MSDPRRSPSYTVVVPTIGRSTLRTLLDALDGAAGPPPDAVVVVDDRRPPPDGSVHEPLGVPALVAGAPVVVLQSAGRGPATARDMGWRHAASEWVAFLDDDVVPFPDWPARLAMDLDGLGADIGGSQGTVVVPRAPGRRPTDWERNTIGLESACWATADLAYRTAALRGVGGFDRRFPRAFREDADLGLRVTEAGWTIVKGTREVLHPVRPADRWVSVRTQRQNRDDCLMAAIHGPGWRVRSAAGPSRNGRHLLTTAAGVLALGALCAARRHSSARALGAVGAAGWIAGTGELGWRRIAPGPRTRAEVVTMLLTSAAIPPAASWHLLAGTVWSRALRRRPGPRPAPAPTGRPVRAVLFDRDGTLIEDVPYNGEPDKVRPLPGAADVLTALRAHGLKVGVVTNQSGVARGVLSEADVASVNARVEELLGPIDTWQVCLHGPDDGCGCRKPAPGLVERAAAELGVDPAECVVVGDIGADVDAARAAGARAVLIPTPVTRADEVAAAPETAPDLARAAARILSLAASPAPSPQRSPEGGRG